MLRLDLAVRKNSPQKDPLLTARGSQIAANSLRQYHGHMNLGFPEMIFLFLLALIMFGPKKLPEIGRQIGRALNEFKRASNEFKAQIETEISQLDLEQHPPDHPASSPGAGWLRSFRQPASRRDFGPGDEFAGQGSRCLKWPPSFLPPKIRDGITAMSFLDHLEELRRRIIYSIIAVAVGFFACWNYHEFIFGYVQRPIMDALQRNGMAEKLVYLNPTEPFNLYLKVAALAGLFVTSPVVLYQVWMFISPGLYRNEKRYVFPFMFSTVLLFLAGGLFGYKMVYPAALNFLIDYGKQFQPMITIGEYTDLFLTIMLGMGVIFEMPILVFFLSLMGIVTAGWMWRNLRYSILVIFIIAAIITPTTDILNMCIFAAPMVALYILSIGIAWLVHPKQRKARQAQKRSMTGSHVAT